MLRGKNDVGCKDVSVFNRRRRRRGRCRHVDQRRGVRRHWVAAIAILEPRIQRDRARTARERGVDGAGSRE